MPQSLYAFIWQVSRRQQIWLALLTVIVALLTTVPLELQRRIVDEAIGHANFAYLAILCVIYLAVLLVQGGLKYRLNTYRGRLVEKTALRLRETIFRHFAGHPERLATPRHPENRIDRGAIVSMTAAEAEEVSGFVGDAFSFPLLNGGTALATLGYLFWVEPKIAIYAFLIYLPQLIVVPLGQRRINRWAAIHARLVRKLGGVIVLGEESKLSTERLDRRFERLAEGAFSTRVLIYRTKFFLTFFGNFIDAIGPLIILAVGGWLVIQGRTEVSTLFVFISGFQRVSDPWDQLLTFYRMTSNARVKYRLIADAMV